LPSDIFVTHYHSVIYIVDSLTQGSNERNESRLNIISCSKDQEYMSKGYHVFLANITSTKDEDKSKRKRLEDVPVVQEFLKVFLKTYRLPPSSQMVPTDMVTVLLVRHQWEHLPLAVGTYTASGNSLLAVGMPCAFYSQQVFQFVAG
nr:reverse transcriptase domain-containing protein [Tanacetum cinerariifolium]